MLKCTVFFINFQYHNSENFLTNDIAEYIIYLICSCALNINIKINYGIANIIFRGKSHEGWYNYSELLSLSQEVDWRELKSIFVKNYVIYRYMVCSRIGVVWTGKFYRNLNFFAATAIIKNMYELFRLQSFIHKKYFLSPQ